MYGDGAREHNFESLGEVWTRNDGGPERGSNQTGYIPVVYHVAVEVKEILGEDEEYEGEDWGNVWWAAGD